MIRDNWKVAEAVLPAAERVLLYGPPGTGKTYAAQRIGVNTNDTVYSMYLTEYTPVSEPRGTIFPMLDASGNRKFEWVDGPALSAYRNGGRLILNEINQASDDCITFLLALLDDRRVSKITLPSGEIVLPHKDFTVVATMNAEPSDLLPALRDRFPVSIRIDKPNPEALLSLPNDLLGIAEKTAMLEGDRAIGMRQWFAFASLRESLSEEIAAAACFGIQADEILNARKMEETRYDFRR